MDPRALLDSPEPITFLDDETEAHDLVVALQCDPGGLAVRVIRGWKCATAEALHDEVGAALQFPGYYGENFAAMDECITDLAWMPADGYLLHLAGAEHVLPDDPEVFSIFLSVLSDAAEDWMEPAARGLASLDAALQTRRPFRTVISGSAEGVARARAAFAALPSRWEARGME